MQRSPRSLTGWLTSPLFSTSLFFSSKMHAFCSDELKEDFWRKRDPKYLLILAGCLIIAMGWVTQLSCGLRSHVQTLQKARHAWTGATLFSPEHKTRFRVQDSFTYPPSDSPNTQWRALRPERPICLLLPGLSNQSYYILYSWKAFLCKALPIHSPPPRPPPPNPHSPVRCLSQLFPFYR